MIDGFIADVGGFHSWGRATLLADLFVNDKLKLKICHTLRNRSTDEPGAVGTCGPLRAKKGSRCEL